MCVPTPTGAMCFTSDQVGAYINALRDAVRVRGARFEGLRAWAVDPERGD
jgi:hypothetical protein